MQWWMVTVLFSPPCPTCTCSSLVRSRAHAQAAAAGVDVLPAPATGAGAVCIQRGPRCCGPHYSPGGRACWGARHICRVRSRARPSVNSVVDRPDLVLACCGMVDWLCISCIVRHVPAGGGLPPTQCPLASHYAMNVAVRLTPLLHCRCTADTAGSQRRSSTPRRSSLRRSAQTCGWTQVSGGCECRAWVVVEQGAGAQRSRPYRPGRQVMPARP